jgi:hypothetical protein
MNLIKIALIMAWIAFSIFMSYGCTVIWTDDVFIGTLFKTVDANDIELIAEPDYLQIGSGHSRTENDKIEAIIPGVGVIKSE